MSFGARLTEARKRKGLTQSQLGEGLGTDGADCSKAVVYGWEKDQHFPRVDQLALICARLGVSADFLLFGHIAQPGLLPEAVEIASTITQLPKLQREWVVPTVRSTIAAAKATIRLSADVVTETNQDDSDTLHVASSNKRRAT